MEAVEWANIRNKARALVFERLPDCPVPKFRVRVRFGIGQAPIFQPCIQLGVGFELWARHEEAPPDDTNLVLNLTFLPARSRGARPFIEAPLVQAQWTADRPDSGHTSAGTGDCMPDPCPRRSYQPQSSRPLSSDQWRINERCHRCPEHTPRRRRRTPCHERQTPSPASRADRLERTASGCDKGEHARPSP